MNCNIHGWNHTAASKRGQLVTFLGSVTLSVRCLLGSGQFDVWWSPPFRPAAAVRSDRPLAMARSRAFEEVEGVPQLAFCSPPVGSGGLGFARSARLRLLGRLGGGGMRELGGGGMMEECTGKDS